MTPAGDGAVVAPVAGLVLAAGAGSRFGRAKALLELDGQTYAERAVRALRGAGAGPVVVVAGAAPLAVGDAVVVTNPDWPTGIGSSLRVGLAALARDASGADAVVVTLADTPLVGADHVRRLRRAAHDGARVAVAAYGGVRRTPVLIGREHWAEVAARAVGDVGARPFLAARAELVGSVECGDLGQWLDVDTPADLGRLEPGDAP